MEPRHTNDGPPPQRLLVEKATFAASEAEAHAERGDYQRALEWLDVVRVISGSLSHAQRSKSVAWRVALELTRGGA